MAMEVIQRDARPASSASQDPLSAEVRVQEARSSFDRTRLSAHQVKELSAFAVEVKRLSHALGPESASAKEVDEVLGSVLKMTMALADRERDVERVNEKVPVPIADLEAAVSSYVHEFRIVALPQVPDLYKRIVEAANRCSEESRAMLQGAKSRAQWSELVALVLFVLGSILAIGSQYFDKIEKARLRE